MAVALFFVEALGAYIIGAHHAHRRGNSFVSAVSAQKLKQARARLENGDIAEARRLCEFVLKSAPRNPEALCLLAMSHLMSGQPAEALPRFERVLAADPKHGLALEHLGVAHLMLERYADAERALRKAVALPGAPASVAMRLGVALLGEHKHAEAIGYLERALAQEPGNPDCHLNLGRALAQAGDVARARTHFEAVLKIQPVRIEAAYNLGVLALQLEQLDDARAWFERVLARAPRYADAMASLGIVLQKQGQLTEARELLQSALEAAPGLPAAHEGMAFVCLAFGRTAEAVEHLQTLLQFDASNGAALAALANALFELGRLDDAAAYAQRLRDFDASDPASYGTLANVHIVRGELDRAIAILESGYAATGNSALLGMLTYQLRQACEWPKWREAWEKLAPEIERSAALGSPFWLLCEPADARQQLVYTRKWAEARFRSIAAPPAAQVPARSRPRIRVGYLSSDLQEHAAAYLIAEVLELHDRDRFEIYAYSHGPDDGGAMRQRLRAACEHFIDIAWEADDVAAERIRADELDVLVELKGYTAGDRLQIMARRPCGVQLTWLGYPGTTGARFIDYLIADPFVIPEGAELNYSERVLRMPHCYQPNDRKRPVGTPRGRSEYGLPEKAFVFCCFNQTYKITPDIFGVWMKLLRDIPESVLWLVESNHSATWNLVENAHSQGVPAERLVFAKRVPYADHLARYRVADLSLDTFPYTSHTILSDALWCGCPTVALCGETFAARVSGSLLSAAHLPDLVTYTLDEYAQLARRMATDTPFLNGIRTRVAEARDHSPLFDSATFARDLENLYSQLVRRTAASGT